MNPIPNIQNVPLLASMGGTNYHRDITKHIRFGFTFEVLDDLVADAVFRFESAPASAADPCVPGAWTEVDEVAICSAVAAGTNGLRPIRGGGTSVTIPAGTKAGAICHATLPCRPNKFLRTKPISGTTDVIVTWNLSGPIMD